MHLRAVLDVAVAPCSRLGMNLVAAGEQMKDPALPQGLLPQFYTGLPDTDEAGPFLLLLLLPSLSALLRWKTPVKALN